MQLRHGTSATTIYACAAKPKWSNRKPTSSFASREKFKRPSTQVGGSRERVLSRERWGGRDGCHRDAGSNSRSSISSRVVLASQPATIPEFEAILKPMSSAELDKDHLKSENENIISLLAPDLPLDPNLSLIHI